MQDIETVGEILISKSPVIVRKRVGWGECDPAGVVYTPRFADFLAAAFMWFSRAILTDVLVADDGTRLATPMKALSLEFHHVLRPSEIFDMTVSVGEVRRRTFDLRVEGHSATYGRCFAGSLTPILVRPPDFGYVEMPEAMRAVLNAYKDRWAANPDI